MDGKTEAVYYRDSKGVEPANTFQETRSYECFQSKPLS